MDTFINLFTNGIATGMAIFLLAVGLSIIFGLMGILNFAHGAFFLWGAYVGTWVFGRTQSFFLALASAILAGALLGVILERTTISRVFGNHLSQILLTMGLMLVLGELVKVVWGPNMLTSPPPGFLEGSWEFGGIVLIKYRLFTIVVGLVVALAVYILLTRTRLGIIVRAGVENPEMVQALGIDIRKVFTMVFALGAGLAALGGAIMGPLGGSISPTMGLDNQLLAFIVVVTGGLGSFVGSLVGALLVGLIGAAVSWFVPEAALAVNVLLMALVLLVKPTGLFGGGNI
ncbi:ABC transporter, permease [Moorella glycerini]|uniref:High-affinity branched-chain amino acid transport system permease protein LivH n=2 Tax=Neomoorella TaxID=44260 RepID=A0A9X7J134_9FIRM|nr:MULTISPECIES: branched-chain amino acid ABC transporter permease [Moorella]PRR71301.1 High-affinity branched-chain amino acid transport system permease protein LivH [Moorella stamsii]QGP91863.1 High-affinity branched-chain amino acid transport system permease protein LivH [Moorella glycerini]CEP66658.1 ABC transporter, permease [Moorella glycerini]